MGSERHPMLYRCCFLGANDTIDALEEIEADTLADAIEDAKAMLKRRPQHQAVELWLNNRCAFRAGHDKAEEERFLRTWRSVG